MTNKQLADHFQKCATHHIAMAKAHRAMASESNGAAATFHKAAQGHHEDHAEHCVECAKACASNADSIGDVHVGTEMGGDNPGGPSKKSADAPFGMVAALRKSPSFGMTAAQRDLDKIAPTEVHGVVSSQREFIPRSGAPSFPSAVDPTAAIDSLRK